MPFASGIRAVTLVVTSGCNLRCRYCYQTLRRGGAMPWPIAKAGIDLAARSRERRVTVRFTGGEPLLEWPLIRRAVGHALSRRARDRWRFGVTTNGLLLTPRAAAFLASARVGLHLSFDGIPAAQDIRAAGSFAPLDRVLDHLAARHPAYFRRHVSVAVTVPPEAAAHLAASIRHLLSKDVRRFTIAAAAGSPGWRAAQYAALEGAMREVAVVLRTHEARTGRQPLALMRRQPGWTPPPPPLELCCGIAAGTAVVVDVDGRLYPCVTLAQSYQDLDALPLGARLKTLQVGHVADSPSRDDRSLLRERARRAGLFRPREENRSSRGPCASCDLAGACAICPVVSAHDPRVTSPGRVSDYLCAFTRAALTHLVR